MTAALLSIHNLTIALRERPDLRPVDGVSLTIGAGEMCCLVGESGSGKSLTALSILRLLDSALTIGAGRIDYRGQDLLTLPEAALRSLRGNRIAMIFQEPMTSLNPVLTIGRQVAEPLMVHRGMRKREALARAADLLDQVGIRDAVTRLHAYPDELSGGQRQRVMIAMALACEPDLLIADEPTTALDVTIAAQILDLLKDMQRQRGMAVLLITHDFDVVARIADQVAVMYSGQVVEQGPAQTVLAAPRHPYTAGLIACLPDLAGHKTLRPIPGQVPSLDNLPAGCRFAPRCTLVQEICRQQPIPLRDLQGRASRCLFAEQVGA